MAVSLTCDEFLEKLAGNMPLIQLALKEDFRKEPHLVKVNTYDRGKIVVTMSEEVTNLVAQILIRTVELIYQE